MRHALVGSLALVALALVLGAPPAAAQAPTDSTGTDSLAARAAAPDSAAAIPPPSPRVRAWQTGLLRADRLEHASLSFTLGLGAGALSKEPAAGAGAALALGLAKEVRDVRHGGFDPVDLLADGIGAALAAWAAKALTR